MLGGEFLKSYVLELDFADRMVRFYDPKRFEVPKEVAAADEAVMKIEMVSNRPFLVRPTHKGGRKKIHLLLDTGAPMPLLLSGSAAKKLGIDVAALPTLASIGGAVGKTGQQDALVVNLPAFGHGTHHCGQRRSVEVRAVQRPSRPPRGGREQQEAATPRLPQPSP